jgi:hypothetical protein
MDATDREASAPRSCGRSAVAFYNTVRPHASLGYRPPAPEVVIGGPPPPRRPGPEGSAQPPAAMLH